MLIQIIVTIKHIATGTEVRVATGSPCLLHIILQRIRNIVVHHQTDIFLIDSHAKS